MKRENMSCKVKIRGFMCQSPASIAVCNPADMRSVIVPQYRRASRRLGDHRNGKYSRLGDPEKRVVLAKANNRARDIYLPLGDRKREHHHLHQAPSSQQQRSRTMQMSSLANSANIFQVVVLRVSLHCQGCAGKVKKHLSRMEGVTSFSIDLETKRVTVMGHVSPAGVLESVSKVKRAEFWPC